MFKVILVLALIALVLVFTLGALFIRKVFHAEVFVPAPSQRVWEVLMATKSYGEWNPTFVEVVGNYSKDAKVLNKVRAPSGVTVRVPTRVTALESTVELRQSGGIPGLLSFDHQWLLEATSEGTRVAQHEVDRGIGVWLTNSDWVEPAYAATNEALKQRVLERKSETPLRIEGSEE